MSVAKTHRELEKLNKTIELFDSLSDGERIIVMDGYNQNNGKRNKNEER